MTLVSFSEAEVEAVPAYLHGGEPNTIESLCENVDFLRELGLNLDDWCGLPSCGGADALPLVLGEGVGLKFRIHVRGSFDLRDSTGCSIRPASRKSCALLAILALSEGNRQTRSWLQSHLWSESDEGRASGSLRQELSKLKGILGDAICADRIDVWLAEDRFEIDDAILKPFPPGTELLQGMDVGDDVFEDWLRDQRQYFAGLFDPPEGPDTENKVLSYIKDHDLDLVHPTRLRRSLPKCTVILDCDVKGTPEAHVAVEVFSEYLIQKLDQFGLFTCVGHSGWNEDKKTDHRSNHSAIVRVVSAANSDEVYLGACLEAGNHRQRLFFRSVTLPSAISQLHESTTLGRFAEQFCAEILDALEFERFPAGNGFEAPILARMAKELTFRLDKVSLAKADALLARAYECDPQGAYLAWRAFLRNTAFFQHRDSSVFADDFSSDELALEALRQSPEKGVVQALSSQLEYINQGNLKEPLIKARRAVEIDRTDPLARALLSNALVVNGRLAEGYEVALQSLELSACGPYEFYFQHFACMAATASGDYETALHHARSSVSYVPDFVSPRRYEVVLATKLGDFAGVERAVQAMRRTEPDFEVATMLDPSYPVNTLRRLPLIEVIA